MFCVLVLFPPPHSPSVKEVQELYRTQKSNLWSAQWGFKFPRLFLALLLPTVGFSFITYAWRNLPKTARIIFPLWQSHLYYTFTTNNNDLSLREKVRVKCFFIDYLPWAKHHSQECSSLRAADCSCIGCELQKLLKSGLNQCRKLSWTPFYQSTCSGRKGQSRKRGTYC